MAARLVIDKGPLSGTELVLEKGEAWSLGKTEGQSDIVLNDAKIAPSQIKIAFAKGRYLLTNLDSSLPVLVNGKPITQEEELATGMRISFGDTECVFYAQAYEDSDESFEFSLPEDSKQDSLFPIAGASTTSNQPEAKGAQQTSAVSQAPQTEQKEEASLSDKDQELAQSLLAQAKTEAGGLPQGQEGVSNQSAPAPLDQAKPTAPGNANQPKEDAPAAQVKTMDEDAEKQNAEQDASKQEAEQQNVSQETSQTNAEPQAENNAEVSSSVPPAEVATEAKPADEGAQTTDKQETSAEASQQSTTEESQPSNEENKGQEEQETSNSEEETKPEEEKADASDGTNKEEDATDAVEDAAKDSQSSQESSGQESKESEEKTSVITPFDVQDLFRFDQEVFPVEMEESVHKHIEADLSQPPRFLLKILSGANVGAEFHLETGKSYVIGSDVDAADIVLNDSSVSHQHAKLIVGNDGSVMIEDLGSKNGVVVEGRKIEHSSTLSANQVVALGTTLFLLIDHLAPADTLAAIFTPEDYGLFGRPQSEEEFVKQEIEEEEKRRKQATLPTGSFILTLFIGGLAVLFGVGTASLFSVKEVSPVEEVNIEEDLNKITQEFPSVRYTFNKGNGQLFLIGHVKNSIDKSELLYKVDALSYIRSVDDNVINDEAVWQEMNILLSKRPEFQGVSMYSPEPGKFVLSGYVKTEKQAACLSEYLNLHFNYLSLLENKVVVETFLFQTVSGQLLQAGFANIQVSFANGEIILTGYVNHESEEKFRAVVESLANLSGVRMIKNFVVVLPVEEGIIDLNLRYPRRYRITGYSKYGDASINVVINGRILTRGDVLDGMTITSIQPNCIFLEKGGLRYKIEYNK